jgi:hypothetical protein
VPEDKQRQVATEEKAEEQKPKEDEKVKKKVSLYHLNPAQEKKLQDVMLRNPSLEDLKSDLIKFQKEEGGPSTGRTIKF